MIKLILLILTLGIFESTEVSDWTITTTETHYKLSYNAMLKTSRWQGSPDPNYTWDGQGLSWERVVKDEDGKKRTIKTYKDPIEIIADFEAESKVLRSNNKIERAVSERFGSLKDFVWLDKVSGGGTVVFSDIGKHVFIIRDRLKPVPEEIYKDGNNYYEVIEGKTHIHVKSFSGVGMAAGTPAVLIAHWKMNENTASDNAELVTDGDMTVAGSWVMDGTWGIADGVATCTGNGTNQYFSQNLTSKILGRKYAISYEITANTLVSSNFWNLSITSLFDGEFGLPSTVGVHTIYRVATNSSPIYDARFFVHVNCISGSISVDNISIKLCAVEDSSGNDHDGLLQEHTADAHVAGKINGAFDFDGAADYIEIADHDDFTPTTSGFSISAWVYMHDASNFIIASKGVYNTDAEWKLFPATDDKLRWQLFDESVDNCYIEQRTVPLTTYENQWLHVVATSDGSALNTGLNIYLNGENANGQTFAGGTFVAVENLNGPVYIGRYSTTYANGLIDNVMIFSVELTSDEVKRLYNNNNSTEILAEIDSVISPRRSNTSPLGLRARYEFP